MSVKEKLNRTKRPQTQTRSWWREAPVIYHQRHQPLLSSACQLGQPNG